MDRNRHGDMEEESIISVDTITWGGWVNLTDYIFGL